MTTPSALMFLAALCASPGASPPEPKGSGAVKVVAPGRAPRRVLRMQPRVGQSGEMLMVNQMSIEMDMGGQRRTMQMPKVSGAFRLTVTSAEGRRYGLETVIGASTVEEGPDADPQQVESMRQSFKNTEGMKCRYTLDERGALLDKPTCDGAAPEMAQTLGQATVPLPATAVGVGARWTAEHVSEQGGVRIDQRTEYHLVRLEGDRAFLETKVRGRGRPGPMAAPGMPAGGQIRLIEMVTEGGGETQVDLSNPLRHHGAVTLTTRTRTETTMGDTKVPMSQVMKMTMSLQPKAP